MQGKIKFNSKGIINPSISSLYTSLQNSRIFIEKFLSPVAEYVAKEE